MKVEMVGLEDMKNLYEMDLDFVEARKTGKESWSGDRTSILDYFFHEVFLFIN